MIVLVFNVKAKGSTSDLVAPKTGKLTCKLFSALDSNTFCQLSEEGTCRMGVVHVRAKIIKARAIISYQKTHVKKHLGGVGGDGICLCCRCWKNPELSLQQDVTALCTRRFILLTARRRTSAKQNQKQLKWGLQHPALGSQGQRLLVPIHGTTPVTWDYQEMNLILTACL